MMTLNKKSWHYRLATKYGKMSRWVESMDICRYTRRVIRGAFVALMITVLCALVSYGILDTILWLATVYTSKWVEPHRVAMITISAFFAMSVIAVMVLASFCSDKMGNFFGDRVEALEQKSGFVATAYRSFRDKYCIKIKFE